MKPIIVKIGTEDEMFVFQFRRPLGSENETAYERFNGEIEGKEKEERDFEVIKQNLLEFSAAPPEYYEKIDGEFKPQKTFKTIEKGFESLFGELNGDNQQILVEAWLQFQKKQELKKYS